MLNERERLFQRINEKAEIYFDKCIDNRKRFCTRDKYLDVVFDCDEIMRKFDQYRDMGYPTSHILGDRSPEIKYALKHCLYDFDKRILSEYESITYARHKANYVFGPEDPVEFTKMLAEEYLSQTEEDNRKKLEEQIKNNNRQENTNAVKNNLKAIGIDGLTFLFSKI
jgi:hypothetical protein